MELKTEEVLKSWVGFLAENTSSTQQTQIVLVNETLLWDTGNVFKFSAVSY